MRTNYAVLVEPTVADVIALLSRLDPSMPFRIEDPDTNWTISKVETFENDGKVWFTGDYADMEQGG